MVLGLPHRQLEGLARGLGKLIAIPTPDYSTLSLRLPKQKLDLGYKPREGEDDRTHDGENLVPLVRKRRGRWRSRGPLGMEDMMLTITSRFLFKRLFGEVVHAKRFEWRVKVYNHNEVEDWSGKVTQQSNIL